MTLSTVWVVTEPTTDVLTSTSLELLTFARSLGASVSAVTWGGAATSAAVAGEYGATTLYDAGSEPILRGTSQSSSHPSHPRHPNGDPFSPGSR